MSIHGGGEVGDGGCGDADVTGILVGREEKLQWRAKE
jgi:hypothetical protein